MSDYIVDLFWGGVLIVLEGIFTIIEGIVDCIDLADLLAEQAAVWGLVPDQTIYLLTALGIPAGISIIVYCISIRMLLNLIPATFTRI